VNIEANAFSADNISVRTAVRELLAARFAAYPASEVRDAARYAALGDGHYWRPIVAVAAGRIFHPDALSIGLPGACGVELAHAASLVLDDLPSMDDARLRRGRACTHLAFPRWAADMTPVFLVTMAYEIGLANERATPERRIETALELSRAGMAMIAGQTLDLLQTPQTSPEDKMLECYRLKSGALYGAAAKAGALLCGAESGDADRLYRAGSLVGLSMQFMDDIADVTASTSEVGKESGKDAGKFTAVSWLGVEGARKKSAEIRETALSLVRDYGREADWFRHLVHSVSWANR
jgi:geranylgeranyl pyrophosphate synthase